jgi:hypothetical protein
VLQWGIFARPKLDNTQLSREGIDDTLGDAQSLLLQVGTLGEIV